MSSPVYGVSGMGPPDQSAVVDGRKALRVGAPEGTSAEVAVERRRRRGGGRVSGEYEGGVSSVGGDGQG